MSNPFDTLGGNPELGFVKKLKKIGKKVDSKVRKVTKKITPKPLRKPLTKIRHAVKNNKLVQGAVVAVASVYGTPAAGAAVKAGFAANDASKARKTRKAVQTVNKKMTALSTNQRTAPQVMEMERQGYAPDAIVKAFQKNTLTMDKKTRAKKRREVKAATKEIAPVVADLKQSGFTDEQINNVWVNSEKFKTEAIKAAQAEAPSIAANLMSSGMSFDQAQQLSPIIASNQAAREVELVREQTAPNNLPLYLGLGLLGFLML